MIGFKISAISSFVSDNELTNSDLEKIHDTSDDWIRLKIGVAKRHVANVDEYSSSLALKAIEKIKKEIDISDIDCLICSTVTPDYLYYSTANEIVKSLNIDNITKFDVRSGCSSSLHALDLSISLIRSGRFKKILLVSSDVLTKYTNVYSREMMSFFGDGAVALVLETCEVDNDFYLDSYFSASEDIYDELYIKLGGSKAPLTVDNYRYEDTCWYMNGKAIKAYAIDVIREMIDRTREKLDINEQSTFLFHQANINIIKEACDINKVPFDKTINCISEYGNTGAIGILLCLKKYIDSASYLDGDIHLYSFGAGGNYGCISMKIKNEVISVN